MSEPQEIENKILKELGDVKRVLLNELSETRIRLTRSVEGVQTHFDDAADNLLGRVSRSSWSGFIVLGYTAAVFLFGFVCGTI